MHEASDVWAASQAGVGSAAADMRTRCPGEGKSGTVKEQEKPKVQ